MPANLLAKQKGPIKAKLAVKMRGKCTHSTPQLADKRIAQDRGSDKREEWERWWDIVVEGEC